MKEKEREVGKRKMNNWITCYSKKDTKDGPKTVQINRSNVVSISLYDDYIEILFVNKQIRQFFFSDWDIKL